MAGILHNVFSKGIYSLKDPDNVSKIKTLVNHSALYFGLIVYTAIGAKVSSYSDIHQFPSWVHRNLGKNVYIFIVESLIKISPIFYIFHLEHKIFITPFSLLPSPTILKNIWRVHNGKLWGWFWNIDKKTIVGKGTRNDLIGCRERNVDYNMNQSEPPEFRAV